MVSSLLPIQTMALSDTVFEIQCIQHFHLHGKPYSNPQFWGFWGQVPPKSCNAKFWPQKINLYANPRILSHFHLLRPPRLVWARVENEKRKKSCQPYISPRRRSAVANAKWTELGRVSLWPNVITPNHFQVYCLKVVGLVGALGMPWSPITPVGFNTAAQLCCLWLLSFIVNLFCLHCFCPMWRINIHNL